MVRIQKDKEELKIMQEAVDLTDQIYAQVIQNLRIGMSEFEISALIHYFSIKAGAQQMSLIQLQQAEKEVQMPHGRPTGRKIKAHEPIMMDFGIQYKNYQSDILGQPFGKPKPEIEKIYNIVLEAQLAGIKAMKTGALASDVDKAARDIISAYGYGEYFDHGLDMDQGIGDGCGISYN